MPETLDSCKIEAGTRKEAFKTIAEERMKVCAGLAAAEQIAELVVTTVATGGTGDAAVVGETSGEIAEIAEIKK